MNPFDPEHDNPDDILAIYLIVNGSVPMTAGKIASQTFQACRSLLRAADRGACSDHQRELLEQWERGGTRTICKIAPTAHLFDRCRQEIPGITHIDEGIYGCAPDTPTTHASWPLFRGDLPRPLRHKRIKLLDTPA
jgi:peptidyl-tRNA hydrolase